MDDLDGVTVLFHGGLVEVCLTDSPSMTVVDAI